MPTTSSSSAANSAKMMVSLEVIPTRGVRLCTLLAASIHFLQELKDVGPGRIDRMSQHTLLTERFLHPGPYSRFHPADVVFAGVDERQGGDHGGALSRGVSIRLVFQHQRTDLVWVLHGERPTLERRAQKASHEIGV